MIDIHEMCWDTVLILRVQEVCFYNFGPIIHGVLLVLKPALMFGPVIVYGFSKLNSYKLVTTYTIISIFPKRNHINKLKTHL